MKSIVIRLLVSFALLMLVVAAVLPLPVSESLWLETLSIGGNARTGQWIPTPTPTPTITPTPTSTPTPTVPVVNKCDASLEWQPDDQQISGTSPYAFSLALRNTGDSDSARNVVATFTLVKGDKYVDFVDFGPRGKWSNPQGGPLQVSLANIPAGSAMVISGTLQTKNVTGWPLGDEISIKVTITNEECRPQHTIGILAHLTFCNGTCSGGDKTAPLGPAPSGKTTPVPSPTIAPVNSPTVIPSPTTTPTAAPPPPTLTPMPPATSPAPTKSANR